MFRPEFVELFFSRWKGSRELLDPAGLEAAIAAALQRAQATIALAPEAFIPWLAERAAPTLPPVEALGSLQIEALAMTCACANGDPRALALLEERYLSRVPAWASGLRLAADQLEELKQKLRETLLLGAARTPAKLAQYNGQGSLESWLRVTTLRTGLNLLDVRRPPMEDERVLEQVALDGQPELDLIKAQNQEHFARAFRETLTGLPSRSRALLRLHHLEGLTPERIGGVYGVHRTTAARWIAQAHQEVLDGTRARLIEELRVTPAECDSLLAQLQSRLHVTLGSLLRAADG